MSSSSFPSSSSPPARVIYASVFFALAMILIFIVKPRPLFDAHGSVVPFGLSHSHNTPLSLGMVTAAVAIASMFMFTLIDLVFSS
jgi:hypothetical protein